MAIWSSDLSRSFQKCDERQAFPHGLTTPEATQARIMAWNAAIERAAQCIECPYDGCVSKNREILNLRVQDKDVSSIDTLKPKKRVDHHTTGGK